MLKVISVREGQNIFDILLKVYGSVLALPWLLEDNPDLEIDTPLVLGQQIKYRPEEKLN